MTYQYNFDSGDIDAWFKIPEHIWSILSKRAFLISDAKFAGWGGGFYAQYDQFDRMDEFIRTCQEWRGTINKREIPEAINKTRDFSQKVIRVLGIIESYDNTRKKFNQVRGNLVWLKGEAEATAKEIKDVTDGIAKFHLLNTLAEESADGKYIDPLEKDFIASLGPEEVKVKNALSKVLMSWVDLNSEFNDALNTLQNTEFPQAKEWMKKVNIIHALEKWQEVAVEATVFAEKMSKQHRFLNGNYLYDEAPVEEGKWYSISFKAPEAEPRYLSIAGKDSKSGMYSIVGIPKPKEFSDALKWQFVKNKAMGGGIYRAINKAVPNYSLLALNPGVMLRENVKNLERNTGYMWRFYKNRFAPLKSKGWLDLSDWMNKKHEVYVELDEYGKSVIFSYEDQ